MDTRIGWYHSIFFRSSLLLFGLLVAILSARAGLELFETSRTKLVELEERAAVVRHLSSLPLANAIWDLDDRQIEAVIAGIALTPGFSGIEIVDDKGKPLVNRGRVDPVQDLVSDFSVDKDGKTIARTRLALSTRDRDLAVRAALINALGTLVVLLAAIGAASILTLRSVLGPFARLRTVRLAMAKGDMGVAVPCLSRRDEVGAMAGAIAVFQAQFREAEAQRLAEEARRASEAERLVRRDGVTEAFAARLRELATALSASSGQVAQSARALAAASDATISEATSVSEQASETAGNVATIAGATEELAASIQQIEAEVDRSACVAREAGANAAASKDTVTGLAVAAAGIEDVVTLIKTIAGQTNLLALNATIEAARAGEAGRGFSVVASEVKNLATQTAKATDEITARIHEIQNAVSNSVAAIDNIVQTVATIETLTDSVTTAVRGQGMATGEIAGKSQLLAQGTERVAESIARVGGSAQSTGSASASLLTLSGGLADSARGLEDEVSRFVKDLAAA